MGHGHRLRSLKRRRQIAREERAISTASTARLRVGLIGANPDYGWSPRAHVPALKALPDLFELTAVCTAHAETAAASAERFEVPLSFHDHQKMVRHPDIDVVVVSVRVPKHHHITMDALEAGKHVYTEWPLAANAAEAQELTELARTKAVHTMVGLQARSSPGYLRLKELVEEGYVGQVLSCSMTQFGGGTGGTLQRSSDRRWQADRSQGANTLTIGFGHALDIFCYCLGDFTELSVLVSTQIPQWYETDTGQMVDVTSPDNVMVTGRLQGGAVASLHGASVPHYPSGLRLEVHGREGALIATQPQMAQVAPVRLMGAREGEGELQELPLPERLSWVPEEVPLGAPFNVAQAYSRFAEAIRTGHRTEPDFETALSLHKLLATVERASEEGRRQVLT